MACLNEVRAAVFVYSLFGAACALVAWPLSAVIGRPFLLTWFATMLVIQLSIPLIGGPVIYIRNRFAIRRLKRTPCDVCGEVPAPRAGLEWGGDGSIRCSGCGRNSWVKLW